MNSCFRFGFEEEDFFSESIFEDIELSFNRIIQEIFSESSPAEETDEITDAKVFHTSPKNLPHGPHWRALGIYVPEIHAIYIADDLPPYVEKFVYWHEVAHSLGIMDEEEADQFAAEKCGYLLNLRRPRGFIIEY